MNIRDVPSKKLSKKLVMLRARKRRKLYTNYEA